MKEADHSFHVLVRSGRNDREVLDEVLDALRERGSTILRGNERPRLDDCASLRPGYDGAMTAAKILIVNPNTTASMTETIAAAARAAAAPGTEITAVTSAMGPASIEGFYDEAFAVPGLIGRVGRKGCRYRHRRLFRRYRA